MAKAAAPNFIKQVTAGSQEAAANSPCCLPLGSSPNPLKTHILSGQWAGGAAGAVLEGLETEKKVLVEERECLKIYDPQELSQVEHNES